MSSGRFEQEVAESAEGGGERDRASATPTGGRGFSGKVNRAGEVGTADPSGPELGRAYGRVGPSSRPGVGMWGWRILVGAGLFDGDWEDFY